MARAEGTPANRDVLLFSQEGKAALAVRDAFEAAHVIEARHGGSRLPCFDDPECGFLGMPATDPSKPRGKTK